MQSLRQAGQNQEMVLFTQGVYEARELALSRMQAEATEAQANGIVGVTVAVYNHVWGEHATEFLATGTAVRRLADEHRLPTPRPSRPSRSGSTPRTGSAPAAACIAPRRPQPGRGVAPTAGPREPFPGSVSGRPGRDRATPRQRARG